MNARGYGVNYHWAAPLLGGVAVLALSFLLIPRGAELQQALQRNQPQSTGDTAAPAPLLRPSPPQLDKVLRKADANRILQAADALRGAGVTVTTAQVVHDLDRLGRAQVALDFLDLVPDGQAPELWRIRFELARKLGQVEAARGLVEAAVRQGSTVPPRDIVEAAYALDKPEMVIAAVENGVLPAPDATLALDLARRFEGVGRIDLVARLDAVTKVPWRTADPWLAIRLARRAGQPQEALRYAMLLPADKREAAREEIVQEQGDKAALHGLLLERAARPKADAAAIAEQLLAAGFRDDALLVLERAAAKLPPRHMLSQRLLYLMGPRPGARELRWLQGRATQGPPAGQRDWIDLYAQRDRPQAALAFLAGHPLANRPDMLLTRLSLARAAGDGESGTALIAALLDQPGLNADQVNALSAAAPRKLDPALARKLTEKRIQTGVGGSRDVMDLAWESWNRGDADGTVQRLTPYLRDTPNDRAALRLMAEAQRKTKGEAAARPWRERALAETPPGTREQAELLESLKRFPEAIAVVDDLIGLRPDDRSLTAFKARLLLANGQPGRARKVLQP